MKIVIALFLLVLLIFVIFIGCKNNLNLVKKSTSSILEKKEPQISSFPNDADGNVLKQLYKSGVDFTKPQSVDFCVAVPDNENGNKVKEIMTSKGFSCIVDQDETSKAWTCYCTKKIMLNYDNIINIQKMIDDIAKPFRGYSDGWGMTVG